MKNLSKLFGVLAISAAPAAFAHMDYFRDSYVGVEAYQTNQAFKGGEGAGLFKKNPIDVAAFAGFKFSHHFGLEAGWDQQLKKKRKGALIENQDVVNLAGVPFNGQAFATTKITGRHPYVGFFGEYKHDAWKFQAMLGASFSRVRFIANVTSVSGAPITILQPGHVLSGSKNKVIPMVRVSALYNFTHSFAVRISGLYRNTSAITIHFDQDANDIVKMKDTFGLGLGLVYSFG